MESIKSKFVGYVSKKTVDQILLAGFLIRLFAVFYSELHDSHIDHIKFTDIDYHVFTNGSQLIVNGLSPYEDEEYRYSPIVALFFIPNIYICWCFGKFILILIDILCGLYLFILNLYQGGNRINSKLCVISWLFNPITIAISTRGSFEPVVTVLILSMIYMLVRGKEVYAGILFGLSMHLKLYPVIYTLTIYLYLNKSKALFKDRSRNILLQLRPNSIQLKFFTSCGLSFVLATYLSYTIYGIKYIDQSFLYHVNRKDLKHNFSIYFFLYYLFPSHQSALRSIAFVPQMLAIFIVSIKYRTDSSVDAAIRLRKLFFGFFCETFLFVSLNKVCTSQYFCWYLIFVPLVIDNIRISTKEKYKIGRNWLLAQAVWLFCAYMFEYQGLSNAFLVTGLASFVFLLTNLMIIFKLSKNFTA